MVAGRNDWWEAFHGSCAAQVEEIEAVEKGLLQDAQRFFLLTQTDNMWKEHLQVTYLLCTDYPYLMNPMVLERCN